jgi:hypothetical protein
MNLTASLSVNWHFLTLILPLSRRQSIILRYLSLRIESKTTTLFKLKIYFYLYLTDLKFR